MAAAVHDALRGAQCAALPGAEVDRATVRIVQCMAAAVGLVLLDCRTERRAFRLHACVGSVEPAVFAIYTDMRVLWPTLCASVYDRALVDRLSAVSATLGAATSEARVAQTDAQASVASVRSAAHKILANNMKLLDAGAFLTEGARTAAKSADFATRQLTLSIKEAEHGDMAMRQASDALRQKIDERDQSLQLFQEKRHRQSEERQRRMQQVHREYAAMHVFIFAALLFAYFKVTTYTLRKSCLAMQALIVSVDVALPYAVDELRSHADADFVRKLQWTARLASLLWGVVTMASGRGDQADTLADDFGCRPRRRSITDTSAISTES